MTTPDRPNAEELAIWPDCSVLGCPRKSCRALNSDKCFPHMPGNEHVKHWKIDARHPQAILEREQPR